MSQTLNEYFQEQIASIDSAGENYVPELVDAVLHSASQSGVSDVHLLPEEFGLVMRWRIDGVLQSVATFPQEVRIKLVSRLKVMAELLTYRMDIPQEGRIRNGSVDVEMRVSTFPTLHGEKAVVRLFASANRYQFIDDLGLPEETGVKLKQLLQATGGVILLSGPAGSGKTTTIYACLREIASRSEIERSIATLEDPIESIVRGIAQSQIKPSAGFDYDTGLRSLMRQDPQVIMVGEIRDSATAEIVFQASLTGHLVLTTFHAGSAAEAAGRLLDMGIEPYQLRSGLLVVVNQRLVRRLCGCSQETEDPEARLGLDVSRVSQPVGCGECSGTGYRERIVLSEMLSPHVEAVGRSILDRLPVQNIEEAAVESGITTRWETACEMVEAGLTSPAEIRRVLGFRE